MRKMIGKCFYSLATVVIIAGCGGGGGGGSAPVPPPVAKTSTATVSGTAMLSLSALVSKASAKLDGVAVEIISYDRSDKELGRAAVTTDDAGGFAAQVPLLDTGGYVIVSATKEGFTQFQKKIDYASPGNIELKAALQGLNVAFANLSTGGALAAGIGKSTEPSFSFAVVRFSNGVKKTLAGKAIRAAKAAGGTTELEINIPAASLPGVKKLKGELETFEPATESENFPGSYTGIVGGREGKMVSLAFDFMKISNAETGENLGQVARKLVKSGVRKAAEPTTTVTRNIYSSSCDSLFIEDYNASAAGRQVPVWSLNPSTGKWVFIGEGTIVDSSGVVIAAPVPGDNTTGCKGGSYRLKILVSNTEFAKSWWNLDHIVFDVPKEVCLSGKFSFSNGDPVKSLSLSLNGANLDNKWVRTDDSGNYTLTTVLLNGNNIDRKGRLTYTDENGNYPGVDVTLGDSPNCGAFSKTLPKPCDVSGKLVDDAANGVPNRWVSLQGTNFYRGASTDSTGAFSSLVACNSDIGVYIGGSSKLLSFNVNSAVAGDETTDDGAKVSLKNLTVPNISPNGYVNLSQRSIRNTGTITAEISAYDEDGNYPVSYTLKILNGTAVATSYTGSINGTTVFSASHPITGLAVGDYTVELALADSKGASRTIPAGGITVSDGSRPPVVTAYASQLFVNSCGSNNTVSLYGSAFDPDGDPLSALWSGTGVACLGNSGLAGFVNTPCDVTVTGDTTYTYTVSDSSKSVAKNVIVTTYSSAPWVSSLTASPSLVPVGAAGTGREVMLTAVAKHSDGINLSGSWMVNGSPITGCPDVTTLPSGTAATCTYAIPGTANAGDAFVFRFTTAGCSKTSFRETTVFYGNLSDVNIVVQ